MNRTNAVALAPEIAPVIASRLEKLLGEVLFTLQKDVIRVALLTGAGVAARYLTAAWPTARWPLRQLDAPLIIGFLALLSGIVTAVGAHLSCAGGLGSAPSCLLGSSSELEIVESSASKNRGPLLKVLLLYPLEVILSVAVLVAVDQFDLTVILLDNLTHFCRWLLCLLLPSLRRGQGGRRGSNGAWWSRRQRKRPRPLPPAMTQALTRIQRRELEAYRRMAADGDPFRAMRDCVKKLGWRACRALFA